MDDLTITGLAMVGTALLAWFPLWIHTTREVGRRRRSARDSGQHHTP